MKLSILSLLPIFHLAGCIPLESRTATCKSVSFIVNGSAQNRELSALNLTDYNELLATLMDDVFTLVPVSRSQTLAGTYCEPSVSNDNNDKLQVFSIALRPTEIIGAFLEGQHSGMQLTGLQITLGWRSLTRRATQRWPKIAWELVILRIQILF